tara:strand:+ start:289 stop:645 length:357 start_codon:yes stop_codon:yes gene_type:complete
MNKSNDKNAPVLSLILSPAHNTTGIITKEEASTRTLPAPLALREKYAPKLGIQVRSTLSLPGKKIAITKVRMVTKRAMARWLSKFGLKGNLSELNPNTKPPKRGIMSAARVTIFLQIK